MLRRKIFYLISLENQIPALPSLAFLLGLQQTRKYALTELFFLLRRNICSLKHA